MPTIGRKRKAAGHAHQKGGDPPRRPQRITFAFQDAKDGHVLENVQLEGKLKRADTHGKGFIGLCKYLLGLDRVIFSAWVTIATDAQKQSKSRTKR